MKRMEALVDSMVNRNVAPLTDYNAGMSIEALKQKYNVTQIAKLGSNENPFGTPDSVKQVVNAPGNIAYYPDPTCSELKTLLAERLHVPSSRFVMGNGSEDIINMICHAFLEPNDDVLTIVPSFGLHILYPKSYGAKVIISSMTDDLSFDIDDITTKLAQLTPKLFFIASPSNPVGCTLTGEEVDRIIASQSPQTLLVFDEAYFEFAAYEDGYEDVLAKLKASDKPYILLRTLSKAYSLAGLRVGYAVCASDNMAGYLNKIRLPFNVNRIAQLAAIAALNDAEHLKKTLTWNHCARQDLSEQLTELGLNPVPSQGNFLFFATHYPSVDLAEALLKKGVIIKPWLEKNYEHYVRVSIGSAAENEQFIRCLRSILQQ